MSDLAEIQQRLDDIEKMWAQDDSNQTDSVRAPYEKKMKLPEMDLSADKPHEAPEEAPAKETGDAPATPPEPPKEPWARIQFDMQQNATRKPPADPLAEKMRAAGWTPAEPEKPVDWAGLQSGIQAAEQRAGTSRVIQQALQAVAPKFHANPNAGSEDIAAAKTPLEVAQDKQRFDAEQQASRAKLLEQMRDMARRDPASPESERARAALRPIFEMSGKVPEGFEGWSAADVEPHAKALTPIAGQKTQIDIAKSKEDAAAAEKKTAADAAKVAKDKADTEEAGSLGNERTLLLADPRAKKLGLTPEAVAQLDRKGIAGIQHQLESMPKEKPAGAPAAHVVAGDYSSIPEADRETVKAIVEGRAKAPDPGSRYGSKILNYVTAMDPRFDSTRFGAYKGVVEHQATDRDIVAAETAQKHIQQARQNIPDNFDSQFMNKLRQAVLTGAGSAEMTPFQVEVKVASDEYAKGLGNNAQSGRQEIEHILEPVQSKEQLVSALDTINHLLATKQQTWKDQLAKVAPKGEGPKTPSGKPFAKRQMSPSTGRVRYLDKDGNTIEETGG